MATFVLGCSSVPYGETNSTSITVNNTNSIISSCPGTVSWINIPYLINTNALGTIATQDANLVGITGGQIQGTLFTATNQFYTPGGGGPLGSLALANDVPVPSVLYGTSLIGGSIDGAAITTSTWEGSSLGTLSLQDADDVIITGGSITGTDLNAIVESGGGGEGTGGGGVLPDLSLEGAAIISAAILALWALAYVYRQLGKQVEDS